MQRIHVGVSYETSLKYLNMFYGNFQYRRIMVGIVREDFWRRIDVAFCWIIGATKTDRASWVKQKVLL